MISAHGTQMEPGRVGGQRDQEAGERTARERKLEERGRLGDPSPPARPPQEGVGSGTEGVPQFAEAMGKHLSGSQDLRPKQDT